MRLPFSHLMVATGIRSTRFIRISADTNDRGQWQAQPPALQLTSFWTHYTWTKDRSRFSAVLVSRVWEYSCIGRQRRRERWAFSCGPFWHVALVTAFGGFSNRCCHPFKFEHLIPHVVRFHLLSTFPLQELDQVALAPHRGRSAVVHHALSPFKARGSWGTTCAWHGAAYTVWRARAADGSYGGDVCASRGRTSLCTVVRVPCWSMGLAGRFIVAPISSASGEPLLGGGASALREVRQPPARRAAAVIGSPRGGGHRLAARRRSSARRAAVGPCFSSGPAFPSEAGFVFCRTTVMVVPGPPARRAGGLSDSDRAHELSGDMTA
jgi:hypothetical protein